ncbi:MAG: hypothetical protein PHH93_03875 [Prolixibacteraceae bacterium]|nr:hypothetical protein [Prolixibacteraceae bacterium]
MKQNRRTFVKTTGKAGIAVALTPSLNLLNSNSYNVEVVNPLNRVPVSMIIDDSTCLVNMAYYGIPQFAAVFPDRYKQDWKKLPPEIPDSFVREFGEWCIDNDVKGKYSVVPYPACTGWVDRFIPGWTKKELEDSLDLIREVILPNWDIHPEMVSHTRVIDIKTGRPYQEASPEYMENWEWSQNKSADELASYQAYALKILKNAGLPCEGITTPGGYGGRNQENLATGTFQAVRDVYGSEIPHYFRDLFTEKDKSVVPKVIFPNGRENVTDCVVSVYGCTGDWFGGWDGLVPGDVNMFISEDLQKGRMVEVIDKGEPAVMVCHWPGIYFNGEKVGFNILKNIVSRLNQKYTNLVWMKLSEIARYQAAKETTKINMTENSIKLSAPFECNDFTLKTGNRIKKAALKNRVLLKRVKNPDDLKNNSFYSGAEGSLLCFNLEKGETVIEL